MLYFMDRLCFGLVTGSGHDAPPKVSFVCSLMNAGTRMEHISPKFFQASRAPLPLSSPLLTELGCEPETSPVLTWLGSSNSHVREQCLVTHREAWETTFPESLSCIK